MDQHRQQRTTITKFYCRACRAVRFLDWMSSCLGKFFKNPIAWPPPMGPREPGYVSGPCRETLQALKHVHEPSLLVQETYLRSFVFGESLGCLCVPARTLLKSARDNHSRYNLQSLHVHVAVPLTSSSSLADMVAFIGKMWTTSSCEDCRSNGQKYFYRERRLESEPALHNIGFY